MKESRSYLGQVVGISVCMVAVAAMMTVSSCRHLTTPPAKDTTTVVVHDTTTHIPPGPPTSMPSAGIIGINPISTNANTGDFEVDLLVADSSGKTITNLPTSAISIQNGMDTVFGQMNTFSQLDILTAIQNYLGNWSADILLDQTGSIRKTDPLNLRLLAAKLLLEGVALLPPSCEVQLTTFQDSLRIPNGYMRSYGPFTHNILPLLPIVDGLAYSVGGGTPLYDAMYNCIDSLATQASNPNKALLVFTDGEDNESYMYPPYTTLWETIQHARQNNVKVFGVVLQVGIDTALIHAAMATGGGIMHTDDTKQMVSYYRAMPQVLQGTASYYKTKWRVAIPPGMSMAGRSISGNMKITMPDNSVVTAPFSVSFP